MEDKNLISFAIDVKHCARQIHYFVTNSSVTNLVQAISNYPCAYMNKMSDMLSVKRTNCTKFFKYMTWFVQFKKHLENNNHRRNLRVEFFARIDLVPTTYINVLWHRCT